MKTLFKLEGIQLGELKIGNVTVEQEYTSSEAINMMMGGKRFVKELLKDLPEMLLDLEGAYETFEEIDERQEVKETTKYAEFVASQRGECKPEPTEEPKVTFVGQELPEELKEILSRVVNNIHTKGRNI